jgi:uncharacterized alkaline shock family protein YloU
VSDATTREPWPAPTAGGRTVTDGPPLDSGSTSERGATVIHPRVVERVAAQAVREVSDTAGTGRRVLGYTIGVPGTQTQATVRAYVDGDVATIDVAMAVIYPAPVLAVTRRTRHHITDRIVELTGLSVRRVDITVVGMSVTHPTTPRVR